MITVPKRIAKPQLSKEDQEQLAEFEVMQDRIRDRVRGVADRDQTGVLLVGRAGTGKTWTVQEELQELKCLWIYRNARMTSLGIFPTLQEHPEDVIVLDDIPTLANDPQALALLSAAMDGDPNKPRTVTYTTKNKQERTACSFRGGIIAITNVPLHRDPLADAVASRIVTHIHEPSDEMIAAFMRHLALGGIDHLTPWECLEVVEFVIAESRKAEYRLDLRTVPKAWRDFRQHKEGRMIRSWQEMVRCSLEQTGCPTLGAAPSRKEQKVYEQQVALDLCRRYPNDNERRLDEWKRLTRKGYDSLNRRRRELKEQGVL